MPAVRRFATRFSEVTGIAVEVQADDDLRIEDRLAAEAFQMVAEGLANVRRHTHAPQRHGGLALHDGALRLRIENPAGPEARAPPSRRARSPSGPPRWVEGPSSRRASGRHRGPDRGAALAPVHELL